ncbi:TPA: hypothetical protein J1556_002555 [Escherichia coli]|nr:hypothetical protein [Escherichia coli]HBA7007099.1 hypothetical protein [Escherichia coli]HBA7960162.1 hypothetical protein [Escherichia coli]HBA8247634.1 hypothetical protein [Escherichia coli]HBA8543847.1 hypothetical protein [Escherichia coli]
MLDKKIYMTVTAVLLVYGISLVAKVCYKHEESWRLCMPAIQKELLCSRQPHQVTLLFDMQKTLAYVDSTTRSPTAEININDFIDKTTVFF